MTTIDAPFAHGFLHRLHASVNAHDPKALAALCCEDVVREDPAAPATLHGRDAVAHFHRDIMFPALPDVRVELLDEPCLSLDGMSVGGTQYATVRIAVAQAADSVARRRFLQRDTQSVGGHRKSSAVAHGPPCGG